MTTNIAVGCGGEQLAAQKGHLEEQAAYSSLTVTYVLKPTAVTGIGALVVRRFRRGPIPEPIGN